MSRPDSKGKKYPPLVDGFGRKITYLRLSVTDRCNLRCFYCMPQADFNWMPHDNILRFEEIIKLVRVLAHQGVRKIRLTGGEPLVRRDVVRLMEDISVLDGVEELCLTTNGVALKDLADRLYGLGLRHINISLDTLKRARFHEITGRDLFEDVWAGLQRCLELGFAPLKINFVMIRGKNDDEITDFARLSIKYPVEVRFIEFMPIGKDSRWGRQCFYPSDQAKDLIETRLGRLKEKRRKAFSGPAELYSIQGGRGAVGFISPLSHRFCSECNRLRVTADGRLRLCLFSDREIVLRDILRKGLTDQELADVFRKAVTKKPARYLVNNSDVPSCDRQMSSIGG
ncbi:MAG: GTP 3',8-cyclase MoaA [Thermodesulfatator sp.]|nr:MAG: GTP 3',8-cyclase MoaA [Thermodesulfatator sp.]